MTKQEEILEKHYPHFDVQSGWMFDGPVVDVFKAMDEYALAFSKFVAEYNSDNMNNDMYWDNDGNQYTREMLYGIFSQ